MLEYTLGIITGLIFAILIVVTMMFFRRVIEHKINTIEKQIDIKSPRPKGYIVEPSSRADEIREDIIKKNQEEGRDTPISNLL